MVTLFVKAKTGDILVVQRISSQVLQDMPKKSIVLSKCEQFSWQQTNRTLRLTVGHLFWEKWGVTLSPGIW